MPIGMPAPRKLCVLTALVLICSILVTPDLAACREENARVVMRVPEEFTSPITCAMHAQTYVAETAIGRSLAKSDRIKVVCRHIPPMKRELPPIAEQFRNTPSEETGRRTRHR